jgi:hypothetical protein
VGDRQRIPAVVCFLSRHFHFLFPRIVKGVAEVKITFEIWAGLRNNILRANWSWEVNFNRGRKGGDVFASLYERIKRDY